MSADPSVLQEYRGSAALQRDQILYGAVHLSVTQIERSLAFWRELIGLVQLPSPEGAVRLGVEGRALVVLHPDAERVVGRGHAGLYHLAIHLPDDVEFARMLVRLGKARVPQSPTDHIFSKATYLHDPDGIMLELTLETPERLGSAEMGPSGFVMFDSEGRRRQPTEPLDVAEAIAALAGAATDGPLAPSSYIGHVHLHVPDLRSANDFYRDVIGFTDHAFMDSIGMADLSAGGRFPHRLAVNIWNGSAARQPPPGTAGLRHFELTLRGEGEMARMARAAAGAGAPFAAHEDGSASVWDPAGNELLVRPDPV